MSKSVGIGRLSRRGLSFAVLQVLEPRRLLATYVTLPHGVLEVTASDAPNSIHATFAAGKLTIDVDGATRSFARAKAQQVIIHALGGDDLVRIEDPVPYTIDLGDGNDTAYGGTGDDWLIAGGGDDLLDGGEGTDTIDYTARSAALDVSFWDGGTVQIGSEIDTLAPDLNLVILGGRGADNFEIVAPRDAHIVADGGRGNDELGVFGDQETSTTTLHGGAGDDILRTGTELGWGNFFPFGDAGDDICYGKNIVPFWGGPGIDTFSAEDSSNIGDIFWDGVLIPAIDLRLMPTTENAVLSSFYGGTIVGNDLDNYLSAPPGDFDWITIRLIGMGGDDTLVGTAKSDTFIGGDGKDTVDYSGRTENLTITLDGQPNDGAADENDDIATDIENVIGGLGNDTIIGNDQRNRLDGGGGDDHLTGGGARDVLIGGDGDDTADADALDRLIGIEHVL
jgi:Ca2+-binding RTX toxin-like protein